MKAVQIILRDAKKSGVIDDYLAISLMLTEKDYRDLRLSKNFLKTFKKVLEKYK